MRKKNFSTPDKKFKVEEAPGTATTSVAGIGQPHIIGVDGILTKIIGNDNLPSMILWGRS